MSRSDRARCERKTLPFERAASDRFARERARGQLRGKPPPRPARRFLPRLYLPDNL